MAQLDSQSLPVHVSGVYHCANPAQTLKIKVHLQRRAYGVSTGEAGASMIKQGVTTEFKWQKKIFSPAEVERFRKTPPAGGQEENHQLQVEYEEFRRLEERSKQRGKGVLKGNTLYTLIEGDDVSHVVTEDFPGPTSSSDPHAPISKKLVLAQQQPAPPPPAGIGPTSKVTIPDTGVVRELCVSQGCSDMYIMAAVRGRVSKGEKQPTEWFGEERLLCRIRYFPVSGRLEIKPDLNSSPNSPKIYLLSTRDAQEFEYFISVADDEDNAGKQLQAESSSRRVDPVARAMLMNQAFAQQSNAATMGLAHFEEPPENPQFARFFYFGEILEAKHFAADNVFLEYFLELPDGWDSVPSREMLSSVTQSGNPVRATPLGSIHEPEDEVPLVRFCHPFEFQLLSPEMSLTTAWPIRSKDWWDRYRVEGYSYLVLPPRAGTLQVECRAWRPVGNIRSQLRSYFVGGSAELQDTTYVMGGSSKHDRKERKKMKTLSRYGFVTEPTGSVTVRINTVIQQRAPPPPKPQAFTVPRGTRTLTDSMPMSFTSASGTGRPKPEQVVEAVERAKRRLEEIRKAKKIE